MYQLSTLHTIYKNSPIGFLFVEVLYEDEYVSDFKIHYSNKSAAAMLGFTDGFLTGKSYRAMRGKVNFDWLRSLNECIKSGQKKEIYDFAHELNQHLRIDFFPCDENFCNCYIDTVPGDTVPGYFLQKDLILKSFENAKMTQNDEELLQMVLSCLTYNQEFDNKSNASEYVCEDVACRLPHTKESDISVAIDMLQTCTEILFENIFAECTLRRILERICKFFQVDSAFVELYTNPNKKTAWGKGALYESVAFPEIESMECIEKLNDMLRKRTFISVPDTSAPYIPARYRNEWVKKNARSLYFLPIFSEERLIGFVSLVNISANMPRIYIVNILLKTLTNMIQNERLRRKNVYLQYLDVLTGYLNFESFKEAASAILRGNQHKNYAIINCDIRRFKYVNDMFGYEVGDALLKYWAGKINAALHKRETFCRVSADNFIVLKSYEDKSEIDDYFFSMLTMLDEFPEFRNKRYRVDCIAGVYLLDEHDIAHPDINKLVDRAGIARNSVKGTGSKLGFYDNRMRERQIWELQMCQTIHDGIKEGQLYVYFQPQYEYVSGNIIGAEALVRWKHPVLNWISPKDFIPVLEKNGLVGELDMFVWEGACKILQQISEESPTGTPPIPISVNVSRLDIYMNDFKDILLGLIKKYRLQPSMLHLEITEGAYIEDSARLIAVIEDLRACGFNVYMDDFGSGYSSLNILMDVPVNVLKLDMNFLSAENSERGSNIISSIIEMAQHIGLPVIAEGVETKSQADYLGSLGCRYMQGYYYAKPMTAEYFINFLKDKKIL